MLREIKGGVGIIAYAIPDSEVELHCDLDRISALPDHLHGMVPDAFLIAINKGCWSQIFGVFIIHHYKPFLIFVSTV